MILKKIASYVGMEFVLQFQVERLYLAVLSLNLNKGSRIVVPTLWYYLNAILWAGHTPVIADTDKDMCMSLESEEVDNIDALMYVPLNGKSGNALEIKNTVKKRIYF